MEVAVEEGEETLEAFDGPEGNENFDEVLGGEVGEVDVEAGEDEGDESDVGV